MAISITRYVDVTSAVAGQTIVPERRFIARMFTGNLLLPPQSYIEFNSAAEVAAYFGFDSEEYARAQFYFSYVSKSATTPDTLAFARWANVAVAPMIFGFADPNAPQALANYTSISDGSFGITIGGVSLPLNSIDFTGASDLADVAAILQVAIRTGSGSIFTASTVKYNALTAAFDFVGGATGVNTISIQPGIGGTNVSALIGWLPEATFTQGTFIDGAIWANGSAIETVTQTLTLSAAASNNFGSFGFMTNLAMSLIEVEQAAAWNFAEGVLYEYQVPVTPANAGAWSAALITTGGISLNLSPTLSFQLTGTLSSGMNTVTGLSSNARVKVGMPVTGTDIPVDTVIQSLVGSTGLTLSNAATGNITELITFFTLEFPEMLPMAIQAATNYDGVNSVQNYMFQQIAGLTPSVSDDSTANAMDVLRVNFYGQTQQAGQLISFYQRGVMCGPATSPLDQNTYANEIWLADAFTSAIMNLLLAVSQVAANAQGRSQILSILQSVVNLGLLNGTISVGKTLTAAQIVAITAITNDPNAFYQVQINGYWLDCVIVQIAGSPPTYQANYTLVYSKDDVIRKVVGSDILI